jgi:hypothetical protein
MHARRRLRADARLPDGSRSSRGEKAKVQPLGRGHARLDVPARRR